MSVGAPHRLDRRKARVAARAIEEKRRHARAALPLGARTLYENGREIDCSVSNISPGGLAATATATPRVNSHVVVVVESLGRLEGRVARVAGDFFAVRFDDMSEKKRTRFADTLTWEVNRAKLGLLDDRRAPRRGKTGRAKIAFFDGITARADYIDVSAVGANFAAIERPRPGEPAKVEERPVHIVRLHERGFAVNYDEPEIPKPANENPGQAASAPGGDG